MTTIHNKEINFHSNTGSAKKYLEDHLSSDGFKYLVEKAESSGRANFTDLVDEEKFKLLYEGEEDKKEFHVHRREQH